MLIIQTCWFTSFHFFLSIGLLFCINNYFEKVLITWAIMSLLFLFFLSKIDFESSSVHQPFQNQLSFCHPLHLLLSLVFHSIISFFSPIYLKCYSYFPWLLWLVLTHSAFAFLLTFPALKRVLIFLVVSIFHFCLGRDLASTDLWAAPGELHQLLFIPYIFIFLRAIV